MKTYSYKKDRLCTNCGKLTDTQNSTSECSDCFLQKVKELQGED